jgi:biopolymer transport protein ExbD
MMKLREKRKLRWRRGLKASSSVNLISMMDILTVLLLFLLKSYVAEGEVMVPTAGVQLPTSTAEETPRASLVVAIDGDKILVGGERVASVSESIASENPVIEGLAARLQALRARPDAIAPAATTAVDTRLVTIQGDRDIEYRVLRKVMFTLSRNGFENVSLAVLRNT